MDQSQFPNILPSDVALGKNITVRIPGLVPGASFTDTIFHGRFHGFPDEEVEVQERDDSCSRSHS